MVSDSSLTEAESEVARRWFAGEATEEELREVIAAHIDRLIASDVQCTQACDPQTTGARAIGTWHYSDCPVWKYLGVDPSEITTSPEERTTP